MIQKRHIINSLFKSSKLKILVYGAKPAFYCPVAGAKPIWSEPESATGPRPSRARAAKKGAAPQHCFKQNDGLKKFCVKSDQLKLYFPLTNVLKEVLS